MSSEIVLDRFDRLLLAQLQMDAALSAVQLGEVTGLSPSQCSRRIAKLVQLGLLERSVWLLNAEKAGVTVKAYILVMLQKHSGTFEDFSKLVRESAEVVECNMIAGEADYLLKLRTRDMKTLKRFLERLTAIEIVTTVRTTVVLDEVKYTTSLPLE